MLQEERDFASKLKQQKQEKASKNKLKAINKQRAAEGKDAVFAKKNQIDRHPLQEQFDKLEKEGKLDRFMEKRHE